MGTNLHQSEYKRIAVMGGTFDPIHYGHLVAAEAARHAYDLEKVLFIPSGRPPHKKNILVSDSEIRYLMTVLATAGNEHFEASRIEIDRPGETYTVDTIALLHQLHKNAKLYFITGADAVEQILTWKDAKKLLHMCNFVAVTRPGYDRDNLRGHIAELREKFAGKVKLIEAPGLAISSSDIRNRIGRGEPIKYLLPEEVWSCIINYGLYGLADADRVGELTDIVDYLQTHLGHKRYTHTMGVAAESVKLAKRYGADPIVAYTAALFHDCAKGYTESEQRKRAKLYGIKIDEVICEQFDLIHGYLSAEIAKRDFKINDSGMLDAIRYHTTGRRGMSLMEKIIYLADSIEPNRRNFPGLADIRKAAYKDINQAMQIALESTIGYNRERNRLIHPLSMEALKYIKRGLQ